MWRIKTEQIARTIDERRSNEVFPPGRYWSSGLGGNYAFVCACLPRTLLEFVGRPTNGPKLVGSPPIRKGVTAENKISLIGGLSALEDRGGIRGIRGAMLGNQS